MSKYPNTPLQITSLAPNEVFVFGSNLAGRHGKGAALQARQWGAVRGRGEGLMGQTYAIPTKDAWLRPVSKEWIGVAVQRFLTFAAARPDLHFLVTEIGCGLAGRAPKDIAPLFHRHTIPRNVSLPRSFWAVRNQHKGPRQPYCVTPPDNEIGENSRGDDCD